MKRTLYQLQDKLSQDSKLSELLLVDILQRSISPPSTPSSLRKSVIERTPPQSPIHPLSPLEPALTPREPRRQVEESLRIPVIRSRTASEEDIPTSSFWQLTGESFRYNPSTSAGLLSARSESFGGPLGHADVDIAAPTSNILSGDVVNIQLNTDTGEKSHLGNRMANHTAVLQNLDDLEHEIEYYYRNFPSTGLDEPSITPDYLESLNLLNDLVKKLSKGVRELNAHKEAVGNDTMQSWKDKLAKHESDLGMYRREVRRRLADLQKNTLTGSTVVRSSSMTQTNSIGLETVAEDGLSSPLGSETSVISSYEQNKLLRERKVSLATAKSNLALIKQDLADLNGEYSKHLLWSEAEDSDVEKAMCCIKIWKEKFSKAKRNMIELQGKIECKEICELSSEFARLQTQVATTESELETAISSIEVEDKDRGLFSDRKSKTTPTQFPLFSGAPNEDFVDFQSKFDKAILTNRVPKSEQLDKLREVLRGKAKAQVPAKTDTVERAWELLKSAFGDPMTLLKFRKQALTKLGSYPDNFTKTNPQKIVEWCLEMERIVDDLIKLGDRDTRLEMIAFNEDTINEIIDMFPIRLVFKMEKLKDEGREKLEAIQSLIEEEREVLQRMAIRTVSSKRPPKASDDIPAQRGSHRVATIQPKGISLFNIPRKLPSCRICKELEKRGDNHALYEAHQGNYPTHCPRWAAMLNDERSDMAKAAKFCLMCLDPKVTYNPGNSVRHKCITNETKNRFSCSVNRCLFHSWVCLRHKQENKELLDKFKQEMQKRNMVFSYIVSLSHILESCPTSSNQPLDVDNSSVEKQSLATKKQSRSKKPPDLSIEETLDKLRNLTPEGENLITNLKDPPLFMFSSTPGRFSDIQIFYDTGNSHVLFKEGTPQNLYGVKTRSGPFALGAVGNTTVWGGDEWACQPLTTRGHREVLIGLCVPKITSNFHRVSLKEAAAELKASAPENEELQSLSVPDFVGGECHVLLGIQYAAK